jgi:cysteine desulfurase/selenocysteine lyase
MFSELEEKSNNIKLLNYPYLLESGTKNISGIIGFKAAIDFCNKYVISNSNMIKELKKYFIQKLNQIKSELPFQIKIYYPHLPSSFIILNVDKFNPRDVANYLSYHNIYVRAGSFCVPYFSKILNCKEAIRISFSIYNEKKEIDYFFAVLKQTKSFLEHII